MRLSVEENALVVVDVVNLESQALPVAGAEALIRQGFLGGLIDRNVERSGSGLVRGEDADLPGAPEGQLRESRPLAGDESGDVRRASIEPALGSRRGR